MQSDTYINDTDSDDEEYSSDSSGELTKNNNVGVFFQHSDKHLDERFMDQSLVSDYDKVRRNLFSRQIMKGILYIDSSIYRVSSTFKSSNYVASFIPVKSVIGFRLLSANLRVPQYNVNKTNNVVKFKIEGSETIHSVTINHGYYSVTELAAAFQEVTLTKAHRVDTASLTVTYYNSSHASMTASKNGMIFKLVHSSENSEVWLFEKKKEVE